MLYLQLLHRAGEVYVFWAASILTEKETNTSVV